MFSTENELALLFSFYHTGGFFVPIDGGLYNKFIVVFLNPNKVITMEKLIDTIEKFRPIALICGSHHAVQLSSYTVPKEKNLTSLKIVAPMGAAVSNGNKGTFFSLLRC